MLQWTAIPLLRLRLPLARTTFSADTDCHILQVTQAQMAEAVQTVPRQLPATTTQTAAQILMMMDRGKRVWVWSDKVYQFARPQGIRYCWHLLVAIALA